MHKTVPAIVVMIVLFVVIGFISYVLIPFVAVAIGVCIAAMIILIVFRKKLDWTDL